MGDGFFPGVDLQGISPALQAVVEQVAIATGVPIRRRCAMPEFARAQQCAWRHRPVTASIDGQLPGLGAQKTRDTFKEILEIWNNSCNVGLQWTDDMASANIQAHCKRIDGSSSTLAWSYLVPCGGPSEGIQLEQRYDIAEDWTYEWFCEVGLHEVGHAMGLDHHQNQDALMYPYSHGGQVLAPTQYELAIVIPMYGPPVTGEPPPSELTILGGVLYVEAGIACMVDQNAQLKYGGQTYEVHVL
jgi:hypothetical protein